MSVTKILSVSSVVLALFVIFLINTSYVESCNEAVCGSVVSKCMLTQSCKCDSKSCSCCKECYHCLSNLYYECCSCVELCPKPNETNGFQQKEYVVEDFDGLPGLFNAITSTSEDINWITYSYPIDFDAVLGGAKLQNKLYLSTNDHELSETDKEHPSSTAPNCTVVYNNQCVSYNKCKIICESMGASSLRWFRAGCCECVGSTCINYGLKDNRCIDCPDSDFDIADDMDDEDSRDYGDGVGPLDKNDF